MAEYCQDYDSANGPFGDFTLDIRASIDTGIHVGDGHILGICEGHGTYVVLVRESETDYVFHHVDIDTGEHTISENVVYDQLVIHEWFDYRGDHCITDLDLWSSGVCKEFYEDSWCTDGTRWCIGDPAESEAYYGAVVDVGTPTLEGVVCCKFE